MKADHKKQLEKNELAEKLTSWWKGAGDAKSSSTVWLGIGVVALIAVLIFVWRYYKADSQKIQATVWTQIERATKAEDLEPLVEANRGTDVGTAAKFQLARITMNEGIEQLSSDFRRSKAIASIEKARTLYTELINETKKDAALQREAMLASARAEEALVGIPKADNASEQRGSLDKALQIYEDVASKFADSPQGKEAADRAKEIRENKAAVQKFYDELAKRYAKPEFPTLPPDPGKDPTLPIIPSKDPTRPADPLKPPLPPPPGEPKKDDAKPTDPKLTPPPGEPKPKDTKPADPKPGEPKPVPPPVTPPKDPAQPPPKTETPDKK